MPINRLLKNLIRTEWGEPKTLSIFCNTTCEESAVSVYPVPGQLRAVSTQILWIPEYFCHLHTTCDGFPLLVKPYKFDDFLKLHRQYINQHFHLCFALGGSTPDSKDLVHEVLDPF